jgi:DNA-binding transcriptional MerR regulator
MQYTVKEIAELTGVTIKTLYHYHKIGLLEPCRVTDAGYRLYGISELERLQQILFYRELDFSLKDIKKALEGEPSRVECLAKQQKLLLARRQRMDRLLSTIEESIILTKKGESMDKSEMFKGLNKEEWTEALAEQNEYLKDKYEYDILKNQDIQAEQLNEQALEAQQFMSFMAGALKDGWRAGDERVQKQLEQHIAFLNDHGTSMDAKSFAGLSRFFLEDDFHRNMLECQQIGLCYYLHTAAEMYAALK